jgi:hypothetical protein
MGARRTSSHPKIGYGWSLSTTTPAPAGMLSAGASRTALPESRMLISGSASYSSVRIPLRDEGDQPTQTNEAADRRCDGRGQSVCQKEPNPAENCSMKFIRISSRPCADSSATRALTRHHL